VKGTGLTWFEIWAAMLIAVMLGIMLIRLTPNNNPNV
jgi:uncharacterized membrane-anchored protein YhcB (DUF1043 family)